MQREIKTFFLREKAWPNAVKSINASVARRNASAVCVNASAAYTNGTGNQRICGEKNVSGQASMFFLGGEPAFIGGMRKAARTKPLRTAFSHTA